MLFQTIYAIHFIPALNVVFPCFCRFPIWILEFSIRLKSELIWANLIQTVLIHLTVHLAQCASAPSSKNWKRFVQHICKKQTLPSFGSHFLTNKDTRTKLVSFNRFFKDAKFEKKIISLWLKLSKLWHFKAVHTFMAKMVKQREIRFLCRTQKDRRDFVSSTFFQTISI